MAIEIIDPRLLGRSKKIQAEENREKPESKAIDGANKNIEQFIFTVPQLKETMPGISITQLRKLISEGKIRTIPAGVFDARWEIIPKITLEEDLKKLVEEFN